jgi:hypothetical protein
MIEPIRRDMQLAIDVEAALQAGNSVVKSRVDWGQFYGSQCYNTVKQSSSLFLSLLLAKLFEVPRPRSGESPVSKFNRSDVASIPLMVRLLAQKQCAAALEADALAWPGTLAGREHLNARDCRRAISAAVTRHKELIQKRPGRRAILVLSNFRNELLAHNLVDHALPALPKYDQLFLLMDAARDVVEHAHLAINGNMADLESYERDRFDLSRHFWGKALPAAAAEE